MSKALEDIAAERGRQIESEGWTFTHDDEHDGGEMAYAAACYAAGPSAFGSTPILAALWPWDARWWKPGSDRRNLVKAGALIVAEIERMDRALASCDTHPKDGDVEQAPLVSGAVPLAGDAQSLSAKGRSE
jgi:hypothetical protein